MQCACAVLCRLWPVWLYHIIPHYLISGLIFGKTLSNIKCVFWFSPQLLSKKKSRSGENSARYDHKWTKVFMQSTRCFCQILMVLEIFSTDFRKIPKYTKFRENPSGGSPVPCVRTDMTKLIVVFRNFTKAPKNRKVLIYGCCCDHIVWEKFEP